MTDKKTCVDLSVLLLHPNPDAIGVDIHTHDPEDPAGVIAVDINISDVGIRFDDLHFPDLRADAMLALARMKTAVRQAEETILAMNTRCVELENRTPLEKMRAELKELLDREGADIESELISQQLSRENSDKIKELREQIAAAEAEKQE